MLKPTIDNDDLKLRFCISNGTHLSDVLNVNWTWGELVKKLSVSEEDRLTLQQFLELSKDRQAKRKNNGYFMGGQMKGGYRNKKNMLEKQILTFDIDEGNGELLRDLLSGKSGLGDIEYVVYSTRTHGGKKIKLRVVVPLRKLLPFDDFQAIARVCAWNLDPNMIAVDNVSFVEAQVMYWPSHCSDIKPIFYHNRGPLLDVYRTLEEWGGGDRWKDIGLLPVSPRDAPLRENSGKIKGDPREKRGVVGAFCRENTVHDVIEKYLSELYTPSELGANGDPSRYTYVPGTSSNGVVVYDGGMSIGSYHGSDPIGGLNVNAFDFLRIVKFGHLDKARETGDDDPRKMRSYKAMEEFLRDDEGVMRELRDSYYGMSDEDLDDTFEGVTIGGEVSEATSEDDDVFDPPAPEKKEDEGEAQEKDWMDGLDLTEKGLIKSTLPNIILILRHGISFKGRFGHNEFTHINCLMRPLRSKSLKIDIRFPRGENYIPLEDHHLAAARQILESPRGPKKTGWGLHVTERDLVAGVYTLCRENTFHPVRDYLTGLSWDSKSRIDKLWVRVCHTPDMPYYRDTARLFLTAACARIMEPGVKFDFMPVLIGPQGTRKSTFVFTLGSIPWSGESEGHFEDKKKFVEASLGYWFIENAEMTHFKRAADDEAIKAMLSGTADRVRLSYRREPETIRRQFVLIGTTNTAEFLRDRHRRIWAIPCGDADLDIEWLQENRDQLFAEAMVNYKRMKRENNSGVLPLYLTGEAREEFDVLQGAHIMLDSAEAKAGIVREWLDAPVPFYQSKPGWTADDQADNTFDAADASLVYRSHTCALEIFEKALNGDPSKYDQRTAQHVGDIMRRLEPNWRSAPYARCGAYGRQRTYVRTGAPPSDDEL